MGHGGAAPAEAALTAATSAPSCGGGNVRVVCRVRPMNDREKKVGTVPAATASTERKEVAVTRVFGGSRQIRSQFHFDEVLTSISTQSEVFAASLDPLVDEVLAGYEATAFAYGQTGTGKTYTMEGDLDSDESRGLVPRTAAAVINRLANGGYADYSVSCQYLEIYNEELSDLLAPAERQQKLDLKDVGGGKGVVCTGLSEVPVKSCSDILDLVRRAQERRRVAETRINARSSRSHCIFTLKVRCRRTVASGELENTGKLHLVDLAGSECAKKASLDDGSAHSGSKQVNTTEEDRERKNINQSLLTLGRVISALRDGSGRVPYRDSKLTRLLQDALGGRCKTVVIATISPALNAVEETISTLTYAEQAAGVKNRPVASSLLRTIRLAASGEIRCGGGTFADGSGLSGGDFAELEMKVAYLTQEVEEAQAALALKYREAQEQIDRATQAERKLQEAELTLAAARKEGEEKAFVAARLASFADGRCAAVAKLSAALDAAAAHGDDLRRRLELSLAAATAGRRAARDLLEDAEVRGEELSNAAKAWSKEWASLAGAAHAAHTASSSAAMEITKEQQRIVAALISSAQGADQALQGALATADREAGKLLEVGEADVASMVAAVQVAASEAAAVAARCQEEVAAVGAAGDAAAEQRAAALCEALDESRRGIEERATSAAADAQVARKMACQAHEASLARVQNTIQAALVGLHVLLRTAVTASGSHVADLAALQACGRAAGEAAAERWGRSLNQLGESSQAHVEAVANGSAAIRSALSNLADALRLRGEETESGLLALGSTLDETRVGLCDASAARRAELGALFGEADGMLARARASQGATLEDLGATLLAAAVRQRSASAAQRLAADAVASRDCLAVALGSAVAELVAARDTVAAQVASLQERRRTERELIDVLSRQREAMEVDAASMQAELLSVQAELAKARGEFDALQSAQAQARARLLEGVTALLRDGLDDLGASLSKTTTSSQSRLIDGEARLEVARGAAGASAACGIAAADEAARMATGWSESIGENCAAISEAQERLKKGTDEVGAASDSAAEQLTAVETLALKWGDDCEQVACLVDAASARREQLQSSASQLEPEWRAAHHSLVAAADAWAEDMRRTGDALASVAATNDAARADLRTLREEVVRYHGASEDCVAAWKGRGDAHAEALDALAVFNAECAAEAQAGAASVERGFAAAHAEATRLAAGVTDQEQRAEAVLAAVAAHLDALPPDFKMPDAALVAAAASIGDLAADAAGVVRLATDGAEALRCAQAEMAQALRERTADAALAVGGACEAARKAAGSCREASQVTSAKHRDLRARARDAQCAALAALTAQCAAAKEQEASATSAGGRVVVEELEKGSRARERAIAASEDVAKGTASFLVADRAALRTALAAAPLRVFEEPEGCAAVVPPQPQAAARPEVELLPRPTEEELLESRRRAGGGELYGKENDPALRPPATLFAVKLDFDGPFVKGKETETAGATHPYTASERKVLGVLNKA